jgi:hypothetical protein
MFPLRKAAALLLVLFLASAAVLPLAASGAARHGCRCAVRMACCEDGTCMIGRDETPADGPEWRNCRREAPASAATPLDPFGRALKTSFKGKDRETATRSAELLPTRPRTSVPNPEAPPPRLFSL